MWFFVVVEVEIGAQSSEVTQVCHHGLRAGVGAGAFGWQPVKRTRKAAATPTRDRDFKQCPQSVLADRRCQWPVNPVGR